MKKIGIVTLSGYFNYGNRLQNYALEQILNKKGYYVETLWINPEQLQKISIKQKLKLLIKKNIVLFLFKKEGNFTGRRKYKNFKKFSIHHLNEKKHFNKSNDLPKRVADTFDYFIVGSDQVWNPFYTNSSNLYHLSFAPPQKRIAYAASFGISELPDDYKTVVQTYLPFFKNISIREEEGAKIIKELTGNDVPIVLDPTLLLNREEWETIAIAPKNKPVRDYLVTYFLGSISEEKQMYIEKMSQKYNLKVIELAKKSDKDFYDTDPSGFVDLIKDASLLLTDSFHGTVFSILFETPFIVFERENKHGSMRSRIDTLLRVTELESRNIENINNFDEVLNINFSYAKSQLESEKNKSLDYLEKALDI
ncbi:polysaccharide pyruvyl transferase family protein [Salimicrobium salexigens]|uniref:Polysaccharide pyruvyl transferase n=1 Tax=Salimicrobium salexigens TaxID=908941 RepID=A0ABY1KVC5_9BACI|nr:polysaccharide pyruvyl transferase family protein [Salimicrobium salexigens]SIS82902.1 Polysaccharide pyruvyl transferase [Salimicrobium salexigens]